MHVLDKTLPSNDTPYSNRGILQFKRAADTNDKLYVINKIFVI